MFSRFCDDARAFNCRAFAQKDDRCFLSGDDSVTLRGGGGNSDQAPPLPIDVGAVYKEKICTRSKTYFSGLEMLFLQALMLLLLLETSRLFLDHEKLSEEKF